jgi:ATP-binding cassette subfamily B protein
MIWREVFNYPGKVTLAFIALLTSSAATLGDPVPVHRQSSTRRSARRRYSRDQPSFRYLMMIVVVLGLASAIAVLFRQLARRARRR